MSREATARYPQPLAVDASEGFAYAVRAAALQLVENAMIRGPKHLRFFDLEDAIARPDATEIVDCLAEMAAAALLEYYSGSGGVDHEAAERTLERERRLALDLANAEERLR